MYCGSLKSIDIPNSVTSIGSAAFKGCNGLTSVTLGNSVTSIIGGGFSECKNITDFYCHADNVPSIELGAFSKSYIEYATLHVPDTSIKQYKAHEVWGEFGRIVPLTGEETSINQSEITSESNSDYYTLDGRKLEGEPTTPGVYVKDGKKVYVK